jgi:4-hydroxy-3-polyprenylbenzoate decarboxylase
VKRITVAISGASGAIYAQRLLLHMERSDEVGRIHLIVSKPGRRVLVEELDVEGTGEEMVARLVGRPSEKIEVVPVADIGASVASGSYPVDGMVIVPCSVSTLGVIATGTGTNLIHRAADVMLKEGRRLILVPRETPLHSIHLENMLRLRNAGAMIVPAMPGFYHRPRTIEELVDHFVFRLFDHLGLSHSRATMWRGGKRVAGEVASCELRVASKEED